MISFTIPAIPVAQPRQRHRVLTVNGRAITTNYTPKDSPANAFKATARYAATQAHAGPPLSGPLSLRVVFVFPRPKSLTWKSKPMPQTWHDKRPDLDNCEKCLMDALKGLVWLDDSQVCQKDTSKVIAAGDEQPRVEVTISGKESTVVSPNSEGQ